MRVPVARQRALCMLVGLTARLANLLRQLLLQLRALRPNLRQVRLDVFGVLAQLSEGFIMLLRPLGKRSCQLTLCLRLGIVDRCRALLCRAGLQLGDLGRVLVVGLASGLRKLLRHLLLALRELRFHLFQCRPSLFRGGTLLSEGFVMLLRALSERSVQFGLCLCLSIADSRLELICVTGFHLGQPSCLCGIGFEACLCRQVGHLLLPQGELALGLLGLRAQLGQRFVVLLRTLGQRARERGLGGRPLLADSGLELLDGAGFHLGELSCLCGIGFEACLRQQVGHLLLQLGEIALDLLGFRAQLGHDFIVLLRPFGQRLVRLGLCRLGLAASFRHAVRHLFLELGKFSLQLCQCVVGLRRLGSNLVQSLVVLLRLFSQCVRPFGLRRGLRLANRSLELLRRARLEFGDLCGMRDSGLAARLLYLVRCLLLQLRELLFHLLSSGPKLRQIGFVG